MVLSLCSTVTYCSTYGECLLVICNCALHIAKSIVSQPQVAQNAALALTVTTAAYSSQCALQSGYTLTA